MHRSFWATIRGKLISRTLVVVLAPLLIIGGIAITSLLSLSRSADRSVAEARASMSETVVGTRVADAASQVAREIAIYLDERINDVQGWAADPTLVAAAVAGAETAETRGLTDEAVEIDALEARFKRDPRIGDSDVEDQLRRAVAADIGFKEVFLTEVNGFNVDFSNPTSDFVQSDEIWWRVAMQDGIHISAPDFDTSSGVFAVDVSVRLEDRGTPVGVIKSSLDIALVQLIADRFTGGTDDLQLSIMGPSGLFLAETASNHDADHIMNAAYVSADAVFSNPAIDQALAPDAPTLHPNGFSIFHDRVGGFAHVGDSLSELRGDDLGGLRVFDWSVVVEQQNQVAFASLAPLEGLAADVGDASSSLTILLVIAAIIAALVAAAVATFIGRRLVEPITRLRDAAFEASEITLPDVVALIDELEDDEDLPEIEPLVLTTGDEVEDLAHSFNSMQRTAASLAAEQARLRRRNVAATFVSLGRRNQNLLARQLEHINVMEASETDTDSLRRLFQLDHLATRMRRNAESLLVLAGEDTPRRFRRPVSVHQVVQAAGGEIEDFGRIQIESIDHALIDGAAASDVAHLLAELLENASLFSPPDTVVQVQGRSHSGGYWIAIVDHGIGMTEDDMMRANDRLSNPAEFDRSPSAYLGHFVIGHLARRHGIHVWLTASSSGGLTANLKLPSDLLASSVAVEIIEPDDEIDETEAPWATREADEAPAEDTQLPEPVIARRKKPVPIAGPIPDPVAAPRSALRASSTPSQAATPSPAQPIAPGGPLPTGVPSSASASPPGPVAAPSPASETTPSGFRRRRRGYEGAPAVEDGGHHPEAPRNHRRSPAEVQASLERFRKGVAAGRAEAARSEQRTPDRDGGAQ